MPDDDRSAVSMTPARLRAWRRSRPGQHRARNGELRSGWTQKRAAGWYGCSPRQWRRYEAGDANIPRPLVLRVRQYGESFEEILDRLLNTTPEEIADRGGVFTARRPRST